MAEHIGQQLGNYRLIKLLGEGGFAEVYLGEHIHMGTHAAVKVLITKLTPDMIEQFRNEARTIFSLEHSHIVRVHDYSLNGNKPYIVMHYEANRPREEGMTLQELRKALGIEQGELGEILGVKQAAVSRMERRNDILLSTLRRAVEAMGGELIITARFPNAEVCLNNG